MKYFRDCYFLKGNGFSDIDYSTSILTFEGHTELF